MKTQATVLATLILLAASSPLPAKKNPPRPFFLQTLITFNGVEIPEGMYELTLESSNSGARVTLWKNGKFVATAPGAWVKNGLKYTQDCALVRVNSDGSRSLVEIRFAGSAKSVVLDNPAPTIRITANK